MKFMGNFLLKMKGSSVRWIKKRKVRKKSKMPRKSKRRMQKSWTVKGREYQEELKNARKDFDENEKRRAREAAEMFNPLLALVKAGKILIGAGTKLAVEIRKLGEKMGILGMTPNSE